MSNGFAERDKRMAARGYLFMVAEHCHAIEENFDSGILSKALTAKATALGKAILAEIKRFDKLDKVNEFAPPTQET